MRPLYLGNVGRLWQSSLLLSSLKVRTLPINDLGQPVGPPLNSWKTPPSPSLKTMQGRFCRLEPLDPERHGSALYEAHGLDPEGRNWTYLPYGPFANFADYRHWLEAQAQTTDPLFFAIVLEKDATPVGVASYLRIQPGQGSIEVGHVHYSPALQRHPAATEAMYLLMKQAFGMGYRRYEWKCDALNEPSRKAAERLGFSFEGVFRQAAVYKGRSRDTAWYSVIDSEWPALKSAFERWLAADNFDARGRQHTRLSELTRTALTR